MDLKEAKERTTIFIQSGKEYFEAYDECYITKEELEAIETVLSELEKKEAIINEMAKKLVEAHGWFYSEFDNFTEKNWIDYFTKKVEGK